MGSTRGRQGRGRTGRGGWSLGSCGGRGGVWEPSCGLQVGSPGPALSGREGPRGRVSLTSCRFFSFGGRSCRAGGADTAFWGPPYCVALHWLSLCPSCPAPLVCLLLSNSGPRCLLVGLRGCSPAPHQGSMLTPCSCAVGSHHHEAVGSTPRAHSGSGEAPNAPQVTSMALSQAIPRWGLVPSVPWFSRAAGKPPAGQSQRLQTPRPAGACQHRAHPHPRAVSTAQRCFPANLQTSFPNRRRDARAGTTVGQ